MKKSFLILTTFFLAAQLIGQSYMTQSGTIKFYSEAALENIEAVNNQVSSGLDLSTGEMQVQLLMTAFEFEKALMKQHFNERYVESHTYPKSKFEGTIENVEQLSLNADPQEVMVKGNLTMHGVTNPVETTAKLQKNDDGTLHGECKFFINLEAYKIKIPGGVKNKVAEDIEVTITLDLEEI